MNVPSAFTSDQPDLAPGLSPIDCLVKAAGVVRFKRAQWATVAVALLRAEEGCTSGQNLAFAGS